MPTQDNFGVWSNLGTVTPLHHQWIEFPGQAQDLNETIRLTFECSDFSRINSFGWLRVIYKVNGQLVVEPSTRIYPKEEKIIIPMPVNPEFFQRGNSFRSFQIMKKHRWQRYIGYTPDINWKVTLEELWG